MNSASIATIARIPYVHTLANQADFLFATVDVAIWSCCEEGLAITASAHLRILRGTWGLQDAIRVVLRSRRASVDLKHRTSCAVCYQASIANIIPLHKM
ncbi:hypothetical protein KC319_g54 [Hortaea werneckii]|nr:hypothetical protein KC319_g54 [Hortaea werneckii]